MIVLTGLPGNAGAEYRVKTSCPSCGTLKAVSSSYKPCLDAIDRGIGVCERVEGQSIELKLLCGKPKCEELAGIKWKEQCQWRAQQDCGKPSGAD